MRARCISPIATTLVAALVAVLVAAPASAILNLSNYAAYAIDGEAPEDQSGLSVAGAGDVNGDGLADYVIGANFASPRGRLMAGSAYVVFGSATPTALDLADSFDGFRIDGANDLDGTGGRVSGAGDVNGDGFDDIIVSAIGDDTFGNLAGAAYIVYGKANMSPVDLATAGAGHTRVRGLNAEDLLGRIVSGLGDINGDGFADVAIGANGFDVNGTSSAGAIYVLFGGANLGSEIDLTSTGWGFRILGASESGGVGISVAGAGDVNGDGLDDLLFGAPFYDVTPGGREGRVYVLFGSNTFTDVSTDQFSDLGFVVNGNSDFSNFGRAVSGAGDVNGDGRADLIIGERSWDDGGDFSVGRATVIFGRVSTSTLSVSVLGGAGFQITGAAEQDFFGTSVGAAGDFNRDGFSDLLIGAPGADIDGEINSGAAYIVYGKDGAADVDTAGLGANAGVVIPGLVTEDEAGNAVSGIGDTDGDNRPDLIYGSPEASPRMRNLAGQSRLVVARPRSVRLIATYRARAANGDPAAVPVGRIGDGTRATAPDSSVWVDYDDGQANGAASSIETVERIGTAGAFQGNLLNQHWQLTSNRVGWSQMRITISYALGAISEGSEEDLGVFFSPTGSAPFVALEVLDRDPIKRTVTVETSQLGRFYLGSQLLLRDGFE